MHRMLLYTLVIVALALVQACQIHHNLTFPAARKVSDCSGHHLRFLNRSLTRDLPTLTSGNSMSSWPELCYYGKPFTLGH
ncbi:uncharacterized protein LOC128257067 [Drosophila gunungcola]|uniref:Secreted protein n=1 Tax=Drosophila gunungcola TaxID=103775 RepID=A0A9P9YQ48_9MUSC|nr:uncharacterized protein LOC128257067 [Drosophila gunungcola]KAI8041051.1 hypothetical protein M5D96_005302 [Drosophila gunungcola]